MFAKINLIGVLIQASIDEHKKRDLGFTPEHHERLNMYKAHYGDTITDQVVAGAAMRYEARTDGVSYADTLLEDYRQFDALVNSDE